MNSCIFTCLVTDIRILKKYTTTKLYINPVVWLAGWLTNMKRPHYTCGNCLRGETRLWQGAHVSFFFFIYFFFMALDPPLPPHQHNYSMYIYILKPCFCFLTLSHCLCFRQVTEGHSGQSAAQRLFWQSTNSSEWDMRGGRRTRGADCGGWE